MNRTEWENLKKKALSLVEQGLMFPYEYKQYFGQEDAPSEDVLKQCEQLINLAENDRQPPDTFTQYVTEEFNLFSNSFNDENES